MADVNITQNITVINSFYSDILIKFCTNIIKVCFNNDYMKIALSINEPIFYNLLHESGYDVSFEPDDTDNLGGLFKPKNENETPKPIEVNINLLYASIQASKRDFISAENRSILAMEFANKYGLLSATRNIRYYDFLHGNFYWYQFAQTNEFHHPYTENVVKENFETEFQVAWKDMLSGQMKPNKTSAIFPTDLIDIATHLGDVEVIFNHTEERIEHIPKTLGAALTLFHLENHNKANKSCKECETRFIDLTKPQKAKFCSEKCKSSNYRRKKVLDHIKKYHFYNEELDLSKTTFTDYKNNSLTVYCKERGKRNISCEEFIKNPKYPN